MVRTQKHTYLDEVTALPEAVARFAKWLWLQAELWLDDGADNESAVARAAAEDTPHINNVDGWAIEQTQVGWRQVEVIDLAVLDVTHTLVVADAQGQ